MVPELDCMLYRFDRFEFNDESLVLTEKGETLSVRHNEARVLAFLLQHKDQVVTKEQILSEVWRDKVVSEQAVFQNISHLRNVLGNDSIKTFPKLGYQWTLETVCFAAAIDERAIDERPIELSKPQALNQEEEAKNNSTSGLAYAFLALLVVVLMSFVWLGAQTEQDGKISLAYIPVDIPDSDSQLSFEDTEQLDFSKYGRLTYEQFINRSELLYPELATQHPFILAASVRQYKQYWYMDFVLKGPGAEWRGELSADSKTRLIEALYQHLSQPFIFEFIRHPLSTELRLAQLSLAHQKKPKDLIILNQLIQTYIDQDELEKAMVMAEKYANTAFQQRNTLQLGQALTMQGDVLSRKDLYALSEEKLDVAMEKLELVDDVRRLSDVWLLRVRLAHNEGNYLQIKEYLLRAAELANLVNDVERELNALTYLSVMALKHGQHEDKYVFLTQAENKMRQYQLPDYQFSKIPMHYAIYTKNLADKEPT